MGFHLPSQYAIVPCLANIWLGDLCSFEAGQVKRIGPRLLSAGIDYFKAHPARVGSECEGCGLEKRSVLVVLGAVSVGYRGDALCG